METKKTKHLLNCLKKICETKKAIHPFTCYLTYLHFHGNVDNVKNVI